MKYLQVDLTSSVKEKANKFSRLLWKLIKPHYLDSDHSTHALNRIKHPSLDLGAMTYDELEVIPFNLYKDNGDFRPRSLAIIEELVTLLYPNATDTKKEQIRNFVKDNPGATVEQILPNTLPTGVEIKTQSQMETDGWFETEI